VDANLYYWTTDGAHVDCAAPNAGGYLFLNLFQGLNRFKIKANTYFELKGFQLHHLYNYVAMADCYDVKAYGFGLAGDITGDCYVDFEDLKLFAEDWLKCNNPEDPNCVVF